MPPTGMIRMPLSGLSWSVKGLGMFGAAAVTKMRSYGASAG